jgi:hypothetical protein
VLSYRQKPVSSAFLDAPVSGTGQAYQGRHDGSCKETRQKIRVANMLGLKGKSIAPQTFGTK